MCVCVRACAAPSLYFDITNLERVNNRDAEVIKKVEFHTLGSTVIMMTIRLEECCAGFIASNQFISAQCATEELLTASLKCLRENLSKVNCPDTSCYVSCQPPITQSKLFSHFDKQKQMTNCNKQTTMVKHCVRRLEQM